VSLGPEQRLISSVPKFATLISPLITIALSLHPTPPTRSGGIALPFLIPLNLLNHWGCDGIENVKYAVSRYNKISSLSQSCSDQYEQALTGETIHNKCFVCGPKGVHWQPPLPPYPEEWDYFIGDQKTPTLSRKLNNIFSLTAIGVYDGDFMKFPDGVSAVTLAGGRIYHRMLPAHEGQHAIRWFIHDPWAMFQKGAEFDIPNSWISGTLAGLKQVNPFIAELEKLNF
jgi:hypothetical protein